MYKDGSPTLSSASAICTDSYEILHFHLSFQVKGIEMCFGEDEKRNVVRIVINPILKEFNLPFLSMGGRADTLSVK